LQPGIRSENRVNDRVSPGDGILPQRFELCKSRAMQTQKEAFGKYQIF
jgi:hypothetical protein